MGVPLRDYRNLDGIYQYGILPRYNIINIGSRKWYTLIFITGFGLITEVVVPRE